MRKNLKRITTIFMVILTIFSCCSSALAASDKAVINVVYDKDGNRLGFSTIKVGETTYYNVLPYSDKTLDEYSLDEFYKYVLTSGYNGTNILETWSHVAENVFRIAGPTHGYNWEFEEYDKWYDKDEPNTSGSSLANCDINLQQQFAQTSPYSSGELEYMCVRGSGLQMHSSLKNVENAMLEQITDVCGERDVATAFKNDVLKFCTGGEGLKLLQNETEQPVLAHIVTNQYDCGGLDLIDLTTERYFSSFGIAFYDFKLTPIIEKDLQYISAADNYATIKDAFENDAPGVSYTESTEGSSSISYIQNPTSATASVGASTSKSVTNSISNSFSESESYSFTESLSVSNELIMFPECWKMNINLGFSASQALSTAYSESTSLSETVSTSGSVNVNLPPYTELGIKQSVSKTEQSVEYNCPVAITYKVAIFGLNAQYYQDKGTGSWSTADYDQGSICVGFGADLEMGGVNAPENLYKRLAESSVSFELSHGNVSGMYEDQADGHDPVDLTYIDWNASKEKNMLLNKAKDIVNWIPMSSIGGKMTIKTDSINTELTQIYPMYDLEKVRFAGTGAYTLGIGGALDLNTVSLIGLNKFEQPYYGFLDRMGTWQLCDKNGNDLPAYETGKGITIEPTPTTQTIIANEIGDYYLRFDIDEHYYTKAVDRKTYITNDDLEMTAIMKLSVTDTGNNHTCRPGAWVTYIPSNCVVEGERYKYCLTCSKRMAVEVIPKADHIPVETITPATCISDGCKTTTCVTCQTVMSNEAIPKTDHTLVEVVTPATCKTEGNKITTCVTCQSVISSEVVPAKGHGNTYGLTTITPTCTRDGEKALYCSDCNAIVGSQAIPSTGHDNGVWRIDFEATPAYEGQMTKYCSTCNAALESRTFAYHTHSLTSWRTNDDGTHSRSCSCGYAEMNECNYTETVTPATCTVDGMTTYKCKVCKHEYSETSSYAQGHSFGEYVSNNDATTEADGTKTAICGACGEKDTVIDEGSKIVGCAHINTHDEHKDSTCTEEGYNRVVCDDCGNTVSDETLLMIDHSMTNATLNPTCEEAGAEISYCKECSYACITEHLAPLGHSELEWVTVNAPSTRSEGTMDQICPACGEVFDAKTVPAITLSGDSTANINFETNIITGFDSGSSSIGDYLSATNNGYIFTCDSDTIGTGTVIILKNGEDLIDEYEAVIFGDVNGDGWYDGMDAIIVDCLANGMLTQNDVSEAVYMAADCNHDGVIDQLDVELLNQAGTLLTSVDQSKSSEELLETSSAYVEYASLIDQSFEIDVENEAGDSGEDVGTPDVNEEIESDETAESFDFMSVIAVLFDLIKNLFAQVFSLIG